MAHGTSSADVERPRKKRAQSSVTSPGGLSKAPSGIAGLDEITNGGLPRARATLVCGGPGCGKTLFGMEFLVRGITQCNEPGVFMAFEETAAELAENVASLGFDLAALEAEQKLAIDYVRVEPSEIETTGEFDLEGLFVRLDLAIRTVGAKRVVLDTIESLFSGLPNPAILRAEIRRLFRWLKDRGMTVVVTAEQGEGKLTRDGLEEYVSDCVLFLDHRVVDQTSTRRLRVVKYRGTVHGTNEYPFLIDDGGFSVLPVTSMGLSYPVSSDRVPSGVDRLDEMLGRSGYYKGSTILVSGTAGTAKTTLAATLARATCERGGRCLYFAYEESPAQIGRNMRSVGIDLAPHQKAGRLRIVATRPTAHGLEMHLVAMHKAVTQFDPEVVIIDPISNLSTTGTGPEAAMLLARVVDFLKGRGITAFFTSLTTGGFALEATTLGISSLVDTWLLLSVVQSGGERNRTLSIVKSRGMAHSNQASEFRLTSAGIEVLDPYVGPRGVLTGSARLAQEAEDVAAETAIAAEVNRKQQLIQTRRNLLEAKIATMREELAADEVEIERAIFVDRAKMEQIASDRLLMAKSRRGFESPRNGSSRGKRG